MILVVDAPGTGFDDIAELPITLIPGEYAIEWRAGTANNGTLGFKRTINDIPSDTGTEILDENGTAYSWDLSADDAGGFVHTVSAHGTLVPTITGGTNDETIYLFVTRL